MKIPAIPNNVYASMEEALDSPLLSFALTKDCNYCYHFNKEYEQLQYDSTLYQNSQDNSETFRSHLLNVACFVKRFSSPQTKIVEIGCGKGGFFNVLSQEGFQNLSGFDVAYEGVDTRIQKRYFSDIDMGFNADMIILRHTLEHIPSPFEFLRTILSINSNPNTTIVIEVPCFDWIIKHQAWWDLSYEHCNYFSEESFKSVFPSCIVEKVFDGQYLLVKADYGDLLKSDSPLPHSYEDIKVESLFSFFQARKSSVFDLNLWHKSDSNGRYWIWGCATKGVLFLYHMKKYFVDYQSPVGCIDINPSKQSKYLPSLGYKVMNPEFLYSCMEDGDTVVASNPVYVAEINSMISTNTGKSFKLISI